MTNILSGAALFLVFQEIILMLYDARMFEHKNKQSGDISDKLSLRAISVDQSTSFL